MSEEPNQLEAVTDAETLARFKVAHDQGLYRCVSGPEAGWYLLRYRRADQTFGFRRVGRPTLVREAS